MIKKYNNKKVNNNETNNLPTTRITFHKDNVLVETKEAVLVDIGSGAVWLTKKGMFDSRYTNLLSKYIVDNFDFEIIDKQTNKVIKTVKGKELAELI